MTERGARSVSRSPAALRVGPSSVRWEGESLVFDLREVTCPLPRSICGQVRLTPGVLFDHALPLDSAQRHWWRPIAPSATVTVEMDAPRQRWSGTGYLDCNTGTEPIAHGLVRWDWLRCALPDGHAVFYDIAERNGRQTVISRKFGDDGSIVELAAPDMRTLPRSRWRIARNARSESEATLTATLEDTPFYTRSLVDIRLFGERRACVHESLDLDRLTSPLIQLMLPFRMPRRRG